MRDKRRKAGRRTVAAVAFFYVNALAVVYATCVYLQLAALQSNRASGTSTSFDRHPQSSNTVDPPDEEIGWAIVYFRSLNYSGSKATNRPLLTVFFCASMSTPPQQI
jgi:hypothetical protein